MRFRITVFAVALNASAVAPTHAADRGVTERLVEQRAKATHDSVTALAVKLAKARDAMRTLAETPAPRGLKAEQLEIYQVEMKKVRVDADRAGAVVLTLEAGLRDGKSSLDSMSELGETESLRLQMAMDRLSKLLSTLSNLLKKVSDSASGIVQNLK